MLFQCWDVGKKIQNACMHSYNLFTFRFLYAYSRLILRLILKNAVLGLGSSVRILTLKQHSLKKKDRPQPRPLPRPRPRSRDLLTPQNLTDPRITDNKSGLLLISLDPIVIRSVLIKSQVTKYGDHFALMNEKIMRRSLLILSKLIFITSNHSPNILLPDVRDSS